MAVDYAVAQTASWDSQSVRLPARKAQLKEMEEINKEVLSATEKAKAKEQYSSETFSPAASIY
jgi:hypothetical protein